MSKKDFDWRNHTTLKNAVKRWINSQRGVEVLPARSWLTPLNIDILVRRPCDPGDIWLFELYEIKASRKDLQRAPYQLETCRILLEQKGATRCYVTLPHYLIDWLDRSGEYLLFIGAMKRFGYGVITVSPALIPTVYLSPETFKRAKTSLS